MKWLFLPIAVAYPLVIYGAGVAGGQADGPRLALFVPAAINAVLLFVFGRSLVKGTPVAEVYARLRGRDLPAVEVAYCRTVTVVWCVFFALNGGVALGLALYASVTAWAVYTGGVAYLATALVFALEIVYRYWRFRPYDGFVMDAVFRRIFPPR